MTKATIIFETSEEVDGYESKTSLERHNVDTLENLAYFYSEATVAGGWTYVKAVALEKEDESIIWSDI